MQLRNKIKSIGGNLELFFIFKFDWFIVIKFNSNKSTSFVAFYHCCSSKEDSFRTSGFLAEIIWQLWCILLRGRDLIYSKWEAEVVFRSISLSFVFFFFFPLFITLSFPSYTKSPCVMHAPAATSQLVHTGGLVQSPAVGSTCITSVSPAEVQVYISLPLSDV